MGYVDILTTALLLYAIGGAAILAGTVVIYSLGLMIYKLLVQLGALVSRFLGYAAANNTGFSLKGHHRFR